MAYDAELVERVEAALPGRELRGVRMFGGLALMLEDRMLVSVGADDLLVRVDPARDAELLTRPGARRATMGRDRSMGEGWISVDRQALASDEDLAAWLDAALHHHARH
ncbi:TfoX/Sxy family protein [Jannaschia sp. R86511]|uniref:TfoX/Sxy family protein n=1 Tax=Jannaschia sp. R86511 TaxID=3093853 RepID=UPI0036D41787